CVSAHVGDELTISSPFSQAIPDNNGPVTLRTNDQAIKVRFVPIQWTLRVVGLFAPLNETDPFWRGSTFREIQQSSASNNARPILSINALTSSEALTTQLKQTSTFNTPASSFPPILSTPIPLFLYYQLDVAHIDANNIGSLTDGLNSFLTDVPNTINFQGQPVTASGPQDTLSEFRYRMSLTQVPVATLLILVVGMVLLFISLVTELLVERQTEAIAILRSRGASRRQIFGAFTTQNIAAGLLVLVIGPLLAVPAALFLVQHTLPASDQGAINLLTDNPLAAAWSLRWFALLAVGASLLVSLLTLYQTTRYDVLALRREATRSTHVPFWQRFYLDGLVAVLALGSYGYALYTINTGILNASNSLQILSPLLIGASTLFLLAVLLLFLRFFPRLLYLAGSVAARRGGAAPMLALSQLARTPRQAVRIILLLTLTTAFAIFSLVFSASQSQRIIDVVNYQVGADFSAEFTGNQTGRPSLSTPSLAAQEAQYRTIPGVLSATVGTITAVQTQDQSLSLILKAVDTTTFAQTVIWTTQDSTQSLDSLTAQLSAQRAAAQRDHIVPAIVDAATWNALHLAPGTRFTLALNTIGANGTPVQFLALTEVQHIPTMSPDSGSGNLNSQGLLVDYQSFSSAVSILTRQPPQINYVWLRARSDAASQASVRAALARQLQPGSTLLDRQAFIAALQHDPVTLNLIGVLAIGTFTPLLLALLGSLLISWLSARSRLLAFAVLRALGSSPGQLAGILSWEQGITYALMLLLGLLMGIVFSAMALPSLILSSITILGGDNSSPSGSLTFQGDLPTIRVIIPPTLLVILILIIITCIIVLGMMVRIVSRPSLSQTLRLNAD
ncbi:MAG TPA: FtsX-like permease family protein, partial [Ktedonobacteraceae bacterium]|nr:FtsX-like permease family protein [Ktedonobacteraceae bacterium]